MEFKKGDLVTPFRIFDNEEEDEKYRTIVTPGEVGEVRYIVPSSENDEVKTYMLLFSERRFAQLAGSSFHLINN